MFRSISTSTAGAAVKVHIRRPPNPAPFDSVDAIMVTALTSTADGRWVTTPAELTSIAA
jgi:hypothetical protein